MWTSGGQVSGLTNHLQQIIWNSKHIWLRSWDSPSFSWSIEGRNSRLSSQSCVFQWKLHSAESKAPSIALSTNKIGCRTPNATNIPFSLNQRLRSAHTSISPPLPGCPPLIIHMCQAASGKQRQENETHLKDLQGPQLMLEVNGSTIEERDEVCDGQAVTSRDGQKSEVTSGLVDRGSISTLTKERGDEAD